MDGAAPAGAEGSGPESGGETPGGAGSGESAGAQDPGAGGKPGVPTDDEQAATIDGRLDRSLEEFDGLLLEEQERIDERAASAGTGSAGGSGAGAASGTQGSQGGAAGGGGSGEDEGEGQDSARAGGREEGGMVSGKPGAGGTEGGGADDRVPEDVGDGSDDDIVARQLREAAMSEEDPELRERLWDEYRNYKASVSGDEES